jgi:hypothetical protein
LTPRRHTKAEEAKLVTRLPLILAATLTLAACGGGAGTEPAASPEATVTEQQPGTESTATVEESGTDTVVSERMAHWRAVVKPMTCEELAHLEKLRLAIDFNDEAESLVAIHDRQAKLHCPQ